MNRFAVVQRSLTPPAPELVMKAFEQTPGLTIEDGRFAVRHQLGILIERTEESTAAALAQALVNNGIPAAAIQESELPELPAAMYVRDLRFENQTLVLSDAEGTHRSFPWTKIRLIAAGTIPEVLHPRGGQLKHVAYEYTVNDDSRDAHAVMRDTLLLMIENEPQPHLIESEHFDFACLGPRVTHDRQHNLMLLLDDLLARAPKAIRNRGAMRCAGDSRTLMPYDSQHSFDREVAWMLWLARQPAVQAQQAKVAGGR